MPELFDSHDRVATLQDGRVIAQAKRSTIVDAGNVNFNIRVPDLRMIEYVLQVEFYSDPDTYIESGFMDKKITGNVVGMTIYGVAAGTTLTVEVIAIGPP